ncbi:hypothetical protein MTO96_008837 [Rhipicephalus appendiculatus]
MGSTVTADHTSEVFNFRLRASSLRALVRRNNNSAARRVVQSLPSRRTVTQDGLMKSSTAWNWASRRQVTSPKKMQAEARTESAERRRRWNAGKCNDNVPRDVETWRREHDSTVIHGHRQVVVFFQAGPGKNRSTAKLSAVRSHPGNFFTLT